MLLAAIALAIVLIADLPDVTSSGVTTEIEAGDAEPQAGFWVELAGALIALAGSGARAATVAKARPEAVSEPRVATGERRIKRARTQGGGKSSAIARPRTLHPRRSAAASVRGGFGQPRYQR